MATVFEELARRLRRTDLLLLRAVRRQRARPAMRAKGQFWGSVITDDEVDALLQRDPEPRHPHVCDWQRVRTFRQQLLKIWHD